eukprot:26606_1
MSTYTLITTLAYIALNIPNAQSISISFATTLSTTYRQFRFFQGATPSQAGDTLVEQLAKQVDATAGQIIIGESTIATRATGGVIIQTVFESESSSSLATITQGLEATIGNSIAGMTIVDGVSLTTDVPILFVVSCVIEEKEVLQK